MSMPEAVYLWRTDISNLIRLERAIAEAKDDLGRLEQPADPESQPSGARRSGESGTKAAIEKIEAAIATLSAEWEAERSKAEEAAIRVEVRGLRDDEWDEIVDEFPPTTEGPFAENDAKFGANERKCGRSFVLRCAVDPAFSSLTALGDWIKDNNVTRGELKQIIFSGWTLTHKFGGPDPKSLRLSPIHEGGQN